MSVENYAPLISELPLHPFVRSPRQSSVFPATHRKKKKKEEEEEGKKKNESGKKKKKKTKIREKKIK